LSGHFVASLVTQDYHLVEVFLHRPTPLLQKVSPFRERHCWRSVVDPRLVLTHIRDRGLGKLPHVEGLYLCRYLVRDDILLELHEASVLDRELILISQLGFITLHAIAALSTVHSLISCG